ncbi:similar to Saccharomyces cerevisiae YGR207C CIR1 Mitochondrial protein that interacts with frataxin (Yfh1p) [Maudiozyma barnettii]|uniref:Probable electron transfer flavoprotein subunit beta n=1 Tax=Maudiozyma barnettii TaxID=61262 RepID=A0A8H2ZJE8_9SACH|nr:Cir1p [Kazachstania barnettii]CAB4256457.1 similar to Saccharomyces cerevisiae YGR207C CIR1 Mitochondrial protein that interacts with frataxin (Yfh1p) [Kazachstania barnettii]CAD1785066.1 similar to Saccharomyces cerevisiae YGR207C CIR1 Mitochondrial protein that interacts with frataxin (Yfh1p) [Kazachstania barnettii]
MSSKLKILVPVKRVLDHQIKPLVNAAHDGVQTQGCKFSINPFDDIAIEEALRIKTNRSKDVDSTHAISIGVDKCQDILRNCLAKGIDSVSLVETSEPLEPLAVAKLLAHEVKEKKYNVVLMGKQAIDDDSNNTGQMLAALLNWPQATNACKVEFNDSVTSCKVTREIDGGEETVEASLPLVITTDLRLNQPRYVGLSKLMKVKRVKIPKLSLSEHFPDVDIKSKLTTLSINEPQSKPPGIMLKNVDELVSKLKDAKLI